MPTCNHCLHCHRVGQDIDSIPDANGKVHFTVGSVQCECHRHAPRPHMQSSHKTWWPPVDQDEWCGEFEPNPHPVATVYKEDSSTASLYIGNDEIEDFIATIGQCDDGYFLERKDGDRETYRNLRDALKAMREGINEEVFPGCGR